MKKADISDDLTAKIGKIEVEDALIFPILAVKSLKDSPFS